MQAVTTLIRHTSVSLNLSDVFTRRSALLAGWACCTVTGFASGSSRTHFWDKEEASVWTSDEIQQLLTNSPWAKQTTAALNNNNSSLGGPSTASSAGRRGRVSGGNSRTPAPTLPKFPAVVRWVSAQPMQQAMKLRLPASLNDHYVIEVSGLPIAASGSASDSFAEMKEKTSLSVKRGDPVEPGEVYQDPNDTSSIYFGFLRQFLDLTEASTATFSTESGPFVIRVRFHLKEMKYHGEFTA